MTERVRLDSFELNTRLKNCFKFMGLTYVDELAEITSAELLRTPNLGRKSLNELRKAGIEWDTSAEDRHASRRYTCDHPGCQVRPFRDSSRRDPTKCQKHQPKQEWVDGPTTMLRDAAAGHNIKDRARKYLEKKGLTQ